jgi:hypothetical protein
MTFEDNTNISICVFFTVTPNDVENDCWELTHLPNDGVIIPN